MECHTAVRTNELQLIYMNELQFIYITYINLTDIMLNERSTYYMISFM